MAEVAIPKPISEAAEKLARAMGISLSELYTAALSAYVSTHQQNSVTELLDQVYSTETSTIEPELIHLQLISIGNNSW